MMVLLALGVGRLLHEDEIMFLGQSSAADLDIFRVVLDRHLVLTIPKPSSPGSIITSSVWSPDGQHIAYVSQRIGEQHFQGSIFIADAAGSNPKTLIANLDCVSNLTWSPDRAQIAVISGCYPRSVLMTIDVQQGKTNLLTNNVSENYVPQWSPDGQKISFKYNDGNRNATDVFNIEVQSGNITPLAMMWPSGSSPVASPDGRYVVYAHKLPSSSSKRSGIYVYDSADQRTTLLYDDENFITSPIDWSSDSQFIVYTAGYLTQSDLFTLDITPCLAQTTSCIPQRVIPVTGQYVDPHWRPRQP
jgi:Tol biopolymer transport system component